jgi:dCMP deaminase
MRTDPKEDGKMKYLDSKEHEKFMEIAWSEAKKARCQKSCYGAVIVKNNEVLATGRNEPVGEACEICLRKEKEIGSGIGSELCFAIHAEQNALLDSLKNKKDIQDAVMYIGHLKDGKKNEFSEEPFCTVCSRLVAGAGLKGVIFYKGDKYVFVEADEFNEESFRTIIKKHGLDADKFLTKKELVKDGMEKN